MAVPDVFLPRAQEDTQLQSLRLLNQQLRAYASQASAADRGKRLLARYAKHPWLSPGVATAYTKWEEQYGTQAARGLAGAAVNGQNLEDFVATKDFQRQVKSFREGDHYGSKDWFSAIANSDASPREKKAAAKVFTNKLLANQGPSLGDVVGAIPAVGPSIKGVSRAAFTALESPYQELQGAASRGVTSVLGALGASLQGGGQAQGQSGFQHASAFGATQNAALEDMGITSGQYPDAAGMFGGVSSGAIALQKLFAGDNVDLGTGFFPGGEVEEQHTRAVRNIASLKYGGQEHFATPGRLFAATVTEPGTDPYNVLSGSVDALAIVKGDPVNAGLAYVGDLNKARKGFRAAEEVQAAGGLWGHVRAFVDGPTVQQYLDNPRRGGQFLDHVATTFAGKPEMLAELGRRTNWKWPAEVYRGIMESATGDRDAVRSIIEPALGTSIDRQPQLNSFAAGIRNATAQHALLAELPGHSVSLDAQSLGGQNGSLRALYNHGLGIGLDDATISKHLSGILTSAGRVERSEAVVNYFNMERDALIAKGVPETEARKWARFAKQDIADNRVYYDGQIADGAHTPGVTIDGQAFPVDKPFLPSEYLGDRIELPPLMGKNGRGQLLARYGRILGIPGSGLGELQDADLLGEHTALQDFLHKIQGGVYNANTAGISMQNKIWKPLALIRGAWTVRVLGEEQIRMAMAGYDNIFTHPLSYLAMGVAKKDEANAGLLDWAADQRGLRHSTEGAFGLNRDTPMYRFIGKHTETFAPSDPNFHRAWANTLTRYSEDPLVGEMARELTNSDSMVSAVDDMKHRFWQGDLAAECADLSTSKPLLDAGIDVSTQAGADQYVDELYDRLHYYTQGDSELIDTIANKQYVPSAQAIATRSSLKGQRVVYDGAAGEVVEHRAQGKTARVLFDDGTDHPVAVSQLDLEAGDQPTKLLTQNEDGVRLDEAFVNHLRSREVTPDRVSGLRSELTDEQRKLYDRAIQLAFAGLMDIPATKLNRSHVFLEAYYNEVERLLPWMDPAERVPVMAQARKALLQDAHGAKDKIAGWALSDKYDALEKAAAKGSGHLTADEMEHIAKGKSLDNLRTLLYDTHKRNKALAAAQLIFPFGEAWKEVIGSWGRIATEKPQTIRKFQIAVNAARGANPFSYIPGAVSGVYADKGFMYKDPNNEGADTFVYPFSQAFNEQMLGVPVAFTGQAQSLSMGFNLIPGVGPAFQIPATWFLNRYLDNKTWDPLRHLIAPYGAPDASEGGLLEQAFLPAWAKKWYTALAGNPKGTNQDAKALNSTVMDIVSYGASSGEYDMSSKAGINHALKDAEGKARMLYFMRGTFQFGAPAAPRAEFLAQDKNKNLRAFVVYRDELQRLYKKDPDTAVAKFIDRFGEGAIYATAPKTLGSVFGQQYTKSALDWERDNKGLIDKYPLSYAEFAPRSKKDEPFSYDAYLRASELGQRQQIPAEEWSRRVNNTLGTYWYDKVRQKMGLTRGDSGSKTQQAYLREVRNKIHEEYPGWRQVVTDDTRVPRVVEELVSASKDAKVRKSNPTLYASLKTYVAARNKIIAGVRDNGGSGDFTRPGFASGARWQPYRQYLRDVATALGEKDPQFLLLWQDTFEREMSED